MKYFSTRDPSQKQLSFKEAVLTGLAPDGGLYIPAEIPSLPANFLDEWKDLNFQEICIRLFPLFITELPSEDIRQLVEKSYSTFRHEEITPSVPFGNGFYLLELFHGPTFAFKDVALQFLGNLFEYFNTRLTIVGATSGDTGGAAIYGVRGKPNIDVFILHPKNRISLIQEAQMTSVLDENVHNVAVEGTFDDCQDLVKLLFRDLEFKQKWSLGAVNSINWARILAQMAYYFHAYFSVARQLKKKTSELKVRFSVPTGNFGDVLAGFYAKKLGLPIEDLIVATNENDILDRFLKTGVYEKKSVHATVSPAMDIQVSSNFERFLWHLVEELLPGNGTLCVNYWMDCLAKKGKFSVYELPEGLEKVDLLKAAQSYFSSCAVRDKTILETIGRYSKLSKPMILDPHTAVGVYAAEKIPSSAITICLSTAHPIKFVSAVLDGVSGEQSSSADAEIERKVLSGELPSPFVIPKEVVGILDRPRRCDHMAADLRELKKFIESKSTKN